MNQPLSILKILGMILFFVLFFLSTILPVRAAQAVSLLGMSKEETPYHTRITLEMSEVPQFEMEKSGQRVDLLLNDADISGQLRKLPEDEAVVKILLAKKHHDLMVSILLRRPPKQVVAESKDNPGRVVLDLYWADSSAARPAVAFRIADMPPRKPGSGATDYAQQSPWDGRWREFFAEYRQDWTVPLSLRFTLPTLPALVTDENSPLWPLQQYAEQGQYLSLQQAAEKMTGLNEDQTLRRKLLVAEARLRSDALKTAVPLLDWLQDDPNLSQALKPRVEYLTAYGQAVGGQPIVAQLTLQPYLSQLSTDHPLLPPMSLLYVEAALASHQDQLALDQLTATKMTWPPALEKVAALRRADARTGLGKPGSTLDAYRDLAEVPGLFEHYLFSCNRAAFSAFKAKAYTFASDLYLRMIGPTEDLPGHDLILFANGESLYEAGDETWGLIGLERAALDNPGSEGSDRARLRMLDNKILKGGEMELAEAAIKFGQLASDSKYRTVREESFFKQALAHYLLAENQLSVKELMKFRRDFHSSALRREADLLLARQLPGVVHQLLADHNDLDAVVLVEQNRKLLLSGRLDRIFLQDLAKAFDNLGLYQRAGRVLLYMFDRMDGQPDQKYLYLPIIESYFKRGEFSEVTGFAGRYLDSYPQGEDAATIYALLLDAYQRQGKNDELLTWLHKPDRPTSPTLDIRAAWDYWRLGRKADVIANLERARKAGAKLQVKEMALLAESYFQVHRYDQAEKKYRLLLDDAEFGPQAHYRTAQLLLQRHQNKQAVTVLKQLVKQDRYGAWGKLARDLLIQKKR